MHFSLLHGWFPNLAAHQNYLEGFLDSTEAKFSPFSFCFLNQNSWILGGARVGSHNVQGWDTEATPPPCSCLSVLARSARGTHTCRSQGKPHWFPPCPLHLPFQNTLPSALLVACSCPSLPSGALFECHLLTEIFLAIPKLFAPTRYSLTHRLSTRATHPSHLGHFKIADGDFPCGPVVKTPCSQCRGHGFDPWSGN